MKNSSFAMRSVTSAANSAAPAVPDIPAVTVVPAVPPAVPPASIATPQNLDQVTGEAELQFRLKLRKRIHNRLRCYDATDLDRSVPGMVQALHELLEPRRDFRPPAHMQKTCQRTRPSENSSTPCHLR
jgi:hypothetical protein